MKRIIFIISVLLGLSPMVKAQCNLPYKVISEFNNDTTAFFDYNFKERSSSYVGKKVSEVLSDIEIPIESFIPIIDDRWNDIYRGVYLFTMPYYKASYFLSSGVHQNFISIEFELPLNCSLLDSIDLRPNKHKWTDQIYNLLKDLKVKEVGILH